MSAQAKPPSGLADPLSVGSSRASRERVLVEHADGAPHVTVDAEGTLHHYNDASGPGGEIMGSVGPAGALLRLDPRCQHRASLGASGKGPARVTSDAYRNNWEAIWGKPKGGQPS